jgi:phosphoribosylformylglycinamidine cyclo-ligase
MFRTFNMGVGLVLVCAATEADACLSHLRTTGERAWVIGRVT